MKYYFLKPFFHLHLMCYIAHQWFIWTTRNLYFRVYVYIAPYFCHGGETHFLVLAQTLILEHFFEHWIVVKGHHFFRGECIILFPISVSPLLVIRLGQRKSTDRKLTEASSNGLMPHWTEKYKKIYFTCFRQTYIFFGNRIRSPPVSPTS